jgi:hypothetical protein
MGEKDVTGVSDFFLNLTLLSTRMDKSIITLFILFLNAALALGQVNISKVADVSAKNARSSIAISTKNPKIMVVAADNLSYHTTDGGMTWQQNAGAPAAGSHAVVLSDGKSEFYYILQTEVSGLQKIVCYASAQNGAVWNAGYPVDATSAKDQLRPGANLDDKGNVLLTYAQFDKHGSGDAACVSTVQLTRSGSGSKWSKPVELYRSEGHCQDDADVIYGTTAFGAADGKEFGAWTSQGQIFMDRSYDGKMWLSNDIHVARVSNTCSHKLNGISCGSEVLAFVDRSKSTYKGSLYMAWSDTRLGEDLHTVSLIRSYNHGDNWTSPITIRQDKSAQQFSPGFSVDQTNGRLYIVYYERSEAGDVHVNLAYSVDSGNNFKQITLADAPFTTPDDASVLHASVTAYKGVIAVSWTRPGGTGMQLMTATVLHDDLVKMK